jgi:two-component system, LuxR family, response regulator FixJ
MSASGGHPGESADPERPFPVICVEDDASLHRALRRLLCTGGFRVEVFSSAEGFLLSEQRLRADCLVLDIRLDGMSGLDLQEVLTAAGSTVPVVFMSAHDDPSTREQAQRAGAVDYLRKPFDDEVLIGAINRAIGRA